MKLLPAESAEPYNRSQYMSESIPVIRVVQADITTLAVDAIVNAANTSCWAAPSRGARRVMSGRGRHHAHFVCWVEPLADLRQQRLDRAGTGQMQQHPILILFDPSGNLEQRENDHFR